ncbi:MAG: sulfotransferase, partial [Bacteroidales bacterium]
SLQEKKRFGVKLDSIALPEDPIFIIGHWRTGSTFLHQLLNLDDRLTSPTVFQVSAPDSFLISRRYYKPIMTRMLKTVRPMDRVKLGFDEPQEDEYAILKMGITTPLEKLIFPADNNYFLSDFTSFLPNENEKEHWKESFYRFTRKLTLQTGKRIVFKNPFHSLRIELLNEMFPKAYFIHIYRNPFIVIPSTIRMWSIVGKQNCLTRYRSDPSLAEVTGTYKKFTERIRTSLENIPPYRFSEVKFETFEADPLSMLKTIYKHMNLPFSSANEQKVTSFLKEVKDYKKNIYVLSPEEEDLISGELQDDLAFYGYSGSKIEDAPEETLTN